MLNTLIILALAAIFIYAMFHTPGGGGGQGNGRKNGDRGGPPRGRH